MLVDMADFIWASSTIRKKLVDILGCEAVFFLFQPGGWTIMTMERIFSHFKK